MTLTLEALEKDAARRWRVEPLPDRSYLIGNGPAYFIFFTGAEEPQVVRGQTTVQSQAIQYLVFSIRPSQKLQQSHDLEVIAFRKAQSAAALKKERVQAF
jgi:hypothetical protein